MGLLKCLPFLTLIVLLMNSENKVNGQVPLARLLPLCISPADPVLATDPQIMQFTSIIQALNDKNQFFNNDTKLTDQTPNALTILDTIEFSKIKLNIGKAVPGERDIDPTKVSRTKPLGASDEFHQWVHIRVKAKPGVLLKGLIVGAIHGPLGLPFGSFTGFKGLNKRCNCLGSNNDVNNFLAIPCTSKARASLTHPDVYVWHADYEFKGENVAPDFQNYKAAAMNEVHLNFNFIDIKCHRAAVMNFFVIAVKEFGDSPEVEAAVTPVFSRSVPSSVDGSPYPFHPDFCKLIDCSDGTPNNPDFQFTNPPFDFTTDITRKMRYNIEYDLCIKSWRPSSGINCPPGPFKCFDPNPVVITSSTDPNSPATLAMIADDIAAETKRVEDGSTDPGCGCPAVATGGGSGGGGSVRPLDPIKLPPWMDTVLMELQREEENIPTSTAFPGTAATIPRFQTLDSVLRGNIEAQRTLLVKTDRLRIIHGLLMFFSFSICGSVSVFIARFYKDLMPGVGCCGRGVWLWAHILLAFFSGVCMWGGIWILIPTVTSMEDHKYIHGFVGSIGLVLFHLTFFSGWIRPVGRTYRGVFISIHAIIGYTSKLFGALPMFIIDHGLVFAIIIVCVAEAVNLLFYGANTVVQCLTDSHMEMRTPRKVCPFLEHKELPGPVPATCSMARNLVMLLHAGALVIVFIAAIIAWPTEFQLRSYYDILLPGHWGESDAEQAAGRTNTTI